MGVRRFDIEAGGDQFVFLEETEPKIKFWLGKYPEDKKRSAVIPLLWLAQKDNDGWLSEPAMREVADRLEMPYIRVYEVATFYTMFQLKPVGRHHIQLCGTTPCMLRGANDLKEVCKEKIGPKFQVTDDGRLSWEEVECLGACVNAPMAQINDHYYEDLTPESFGELIEQLRNGADVTPGPMVDRQRSAPIGSPTSLTDDALFDGSRAGSLVLPNLPVAEEQAAETPLSDAAPETKEDAEKPAEEAAEGASPTLLAMPADGADDLKRIKGVGPKNEAALNDLGIFKFSQIAEWTASNVKWVESRLDFPGRITRENWIDQAKQLATGAETEFSKRVDAGAVPSSKEEGE